MILLYSISLLTGFVLYCMMLRFGLNIFIHNELTVSNLRKIIFVSLRNNKYSHNSNVNFQIPKLLILGEYPPSQNYM